jgi:hypothetical protein
VVFPVLEDVEFCTTAQGVVSSISACVVRDMVRCGVCGGSSYPSCSSVWWVCEDFIIEPPSYENAGIFILDLFWRASCL